MSQSIIYIHHFLFQTFLLVTLILTVSQSQYPIFTIKRNLEKSTTNKKLGKYIHDKVPQLHLKIAKNFS